VAGESQWCARQKLTEQDIEAILHCIRSAAEAVPLGEANSLPILFGDQILGELSRRTAQGKGENRLRLTMVCVIRQSTSKIRRPG
jgi:hypothetical protein